MPYAYHSLGCAVRTAYCTTSRTTSGRSAPPSPTTRSASSVATGIASTNSSSARASVTSSTRSLWRIDGGTPRCHRCHRRLRLHRRRQRLPATRRTPNSTTTAQLGTRSLRAAGARVAQRYFSRRAQTALRSACARTRSAPAAPTARGTTPPVPPTNASSSAPLTPPHRAVSPVRTPSASIAGRRAACPLGAERKRVPYVPHTVAPQGRVRQGSRPPGLLCMWRKALHRPIPPLLGLQRRAARGTYEEKTAIPRVATAATVASSAVSTASVSSSAAAAFPAVASASNDRSNHCPVVGVGHGGRVGRMLRPGSDAFLAQDADRGGTAQATSAQRRCVHYAPV